VLLHAGATGWPPLSYQWQFQPATCVDATDVFLVLTNFQLEHGAYTVRLSTPAGTVVSPPTALTFSATVPVVGVMPSPQFTYPGGSVRLTILAAGAQAARHTSGASRAPICPDGTNPVLVLDPVTYDQAGRFYFFSPSGAFAHAFVWHRDTAAKNSNICCVLR